MAVVSYLYNRTSLTSDDNKLSTTFGFGQNSFKSNLKFISLQITLSFIGGAYVWIRNITKFIIFRWIIDFSVHKDDASHRSIDLFLIVLNRFNNSSDHFTKRSRTGWDLDNWSIGNTLILYAYFNPTVLD